MIPVTIVMIVVSIVGFYTESSSFMPFISPLKCCLLKQNFPYHQFKVAPVTVYISRYFVPFIALMELLDVS